MVDLEQWKLPPISQKNERYETTSLKERGQSSPKKIIMSKSVVCPFSVPNDEEVLRYYELEKEKRSASKHELQNCKIWDKMTSSHKHTLKHFKNFQVELDSNIKSKTTFSDRQKKLIQEALEVAKERQNTLAPNQRESIQEMLDQKKEMLLVSMSHDIISSEIIRLQKQTEERDKSLYDSEKMLKQDYDNFQKFLDRNKQKRNEAESKADQANRQKRMKEVQIKELNLKLTTIRAENAKNEEILSTLKEHKEFLDKLVPKEWEEEKEMKRLKLIEELKQQYFEFKLDPQEKVSKTQTKGKKEVNISSAQQNAEKNKPQVQKSEELFQQMMNNGELHDLEAFEMSYPMYFQQPDQLQDFFNTLEEKNLFLMQMKQEDEQNFEELKHKSKIEKQFLNNKSRVLQEQKDLLKKQIDELNSAMRNMKQSQDESQSKKDDINYRELAVLIEDLQVTFKEEVSLHSSNQDKTLSILSQVESLFEKLFKEIKIYPIKTVEEKRKKAEKDRKQEQRDVQNERKKEELERRNEKNRMKMTQQTKKKTGRIDMLRSAPFQKETQREEEDNGNQEDQDIKYFREDFNLL